MRGAVGNQGEMDEHYVDDSAVYPELAGLLDCLRLLEHPVSPAAQAAQVAAAARTSLELSGRSSAGASSRFAGTVPVLAGHLARAAATALVVLVTVGGLAVAQALPGSWHQVARDVTGVVGFEPAPQSATAADPQPERPASPTAAPPEPVAAATPSSSSQPSTDLQYSPRHSTDTPTAIARCRWHWWGIRR